LAELRTTNHNRAEREKTMATPRKIYVVTGSEDGPIGVFSNRKKAVARCAWYLYQDDELAQDFNRKEMYREALKPSKRNYCSFENKNNRPGWGATAWYEVFYMND